MASNGKEMNLKLLVDGASKKVLYAEAKKDFVDFLFGLLQLPIGSITSLLVKNGLQVKGSLCRVLQSVSDMETSHFHSSQLKDTLLNTKLSSQHADQSSYNPPLLLQEFGSWDSTGQAPTHCTNCRIPLTLRCSRCHNNYYGSSSETSAAPVDPTKVEGYVKEDNCGYMVMDDLVVSPMSTISIFALFKKFKIKDLGLLEEKTVQIDIKKGLALVQASMESDTALTDVFISM